MSHGWYLAIEVDKKNGPLLLSRDGEYLRSGNELVYHLSTNRGQHKVLNLCWEEPDEKLRLDYQNEHPSIPVSRIVSAEITKRAGSGNKRKIKSEPDLEIKAKSGVKIKAEPGVKIKAEPGVKIKAESDGKTTQERFKNVSKKGGKQQNTDIEVSIRPLEDIC